MTVQKFYRVAGGSTQQKGVVPDIVLPSVLDALELGETTLPYYLPYDTVPAATYDNFNLAAPYLTAAEGQLGRARGGLARLQLRAAGHRLLQEEGAGQHRLAQRGHPPQGTGRPEGAERAQRKKDLAARKSTRDTELDLTLDMVAQNQPAAPPTNKKPKIDPDDADDSDAHLNSAINNPTDDPQLDEAVNIMADYTQMLQDADSKLVQTAPAGPASAPKQ